VKPDVGGFECDFVVRGTIVDPAANGSGYADQKLRAHSMRMCSADGFARDVVDGKDPSGHEGQGVEFDGGQ
jgi:hypothetical protein